MSMCVLGMSQEFKSKNIAVNALWPKSVIATAAIAMLGDMVKLENCRKPSIVADSAYEIFTRDSKTCTGNFFIDEEILMEKGINDFSEYAIDSTKPLQIDLFLDWVVLGIGYDVMKLDIKIFGRLYGIFNFCLI